MRAGRRLRYIRADVQVRTLYYTAISEYIELAKRKKNELLRKKQGKKGASNKLEYDDQVMVSVFLAMW